MFPNTQNPNFNQDGELDFGTQPAQVKSSKPKVIWLIAAAIILLLALVVIFKDAILKHFFGQKPQESFVVSVQPSIAQAHNKETDRFLNPQTGERWYDRPQVLPAQGWIIEETDGIVYKKVGQRDNAEIVLVCPDTVYANCDLFERRENGIFIITNPQGENLSQGDYDLNRMQANIISSIQVDTTTHYDSLTLPSQISIENDEFVRIPNVYHVGKIDSFSDETGAEIKEIFTYGFSKVLKKSVTDLDTKLTSISYYLKFPFGTVQELVYEPNSLLLKDYVFTNNIKANDVLMPATRGCGESEYAVTKVDFQISDLLEVGETNTGRAVYQPRDKKSNLYQKLYQEYKDDLDAVALSFDDYVKNHGLLVVGNNQQEWLLYLREQYAPVYGCGKPVIYLYPESPTLVDVKIGAKVEISEPFYPQATGWQKVWAEPSGQLTYQGKKYDSLFWEGIGYGKYPSIQSGVVVARAEALPTIRRHLKELGLNEKESADFIEYWQNYIPNKAFVRLTWFNTEELDILAPLKVTPKPDAVIRVFLDMAGSDEWFDLPAQDLSSIPRRGFTLVEWGGLVSGF